MFKQKIPLVGLVVFAAGAVAAFLYLRPSPEERLRAAAMKHAATLGKVRGVEMAGTVADIDLGPETPHVFAAFEERDGEWVYAKNLREDFIKTVQQPEWERGILERLAQRLVERYRVDIKLKEGLRYDFDIVREGDKIVGHCQLRFAFPGGSEKEPPPTGKYAERLVYRNGTWERQGGGSLFESVRPPQ